MKPWHPYVPLWCKSNYSFLEGASHPGELVEEAHRLGLQSIALTDRDGVYGIVRAFVRAEELGIKLIVGAQITLHDGSPLLLLAMNRQGYGNLCRLISLGRLRSPKGESMVEVAGVCAHAEGLLALWGGKTAAITAPQEPVFMARQLMEAFDDRLYALLTRHREAGEERQEARLRERARRWGLPLVAGMEVLYHTPARRPLQDVLTCIRRGITLSTAGVHTLPNAEHSLRAPRGFAMLYPDLPEAVQRTETVAERCTFSLRELRYRYPLESGGAGDDPVERLRHLTFAGARWRWQGDPPPSALRQIEKELALIHELEFEGYFLTMHDLVAFCKAQDILCQGRGSAANSVVCYSLGITAVDPMRMGLLFERFMSRERPEPPDIDLDIEHDRREEVIQHMYAKYGRSHAAMVANVIRYRPKSALRDVGKALGIPETQLERTSKRFTCHEHPGQSALETLDGNKRSHVLLTQLMGEIEDFPRHLSIHPGGFLLGRDPIQELVPVENATMPGRTVIQWDKEDVEDLGLFKVDLLGLGALNVVHRSFDLIQQHDHKTFSLATIPPRDQATFAMIQQADTVGVFQIESRAQMSMLPRLKPENYYDLVIQVSIVRPGPITGGMVHPYLRRRQRLEEVTYPHPCLEPVLKKTLGVPLFQEQVMQLAMTAAGYSPGEADQLRRDMAAWRQSGRIEKHRDRLISRMIRKGIAQAFAERVFEQIKGFGEYGFPESHAASFALIAYATAWLKCHYPAHFLCALLNAQPMGFYSPATLIEDGKRHGVVVYPVDVLHSAVDCHLVAASESAGGWALRMGLGYVKGLGAAERSRIVAAREEMAFTAIDDLARRARLERATVTRLAECGALRGLETDRRSALWQALATPPGNEHHHDGLVLPQQEKGPSLTPLEVHEEINWDYAFSSHSTRGHPLAPFREALQAQGLPEAAALPHRKSGQPVRYAGLVICRQRPGTAKGVLFMTLEDETGLVNLVVWQQVLEKYERLAKTQTFLGVTGKLQIEAGVTHIIVHRLWVPQLQHHPAPTKSRDFH